MRVKFLLVGMVVVACGRAPLSQPRAIHDRGVILGMQVAELGEGESAHELVLCPRAAEYTAEYFSASCQLALSSRSGKRVVFTKQPENVESSGQQELVMVIAAPVATGVLAWLLAMRHHYGLSETEKTKQRKWLRPGAVASTFGIIALGTVAFALLFDQYTAGADKRAVARHFNAIFDTDTDFAAATEVHAVGKILNALAAQLELKVTPGAQRLLHDN